MIVSNQRQALCQRRAVGFLGSGEPGLVSQAFSHQQYFHCLILTWVMTPQPATSTNQDQPMTTTLPTSYFPGPSPIDSPQNLKEFKTNG